MTEGTLGLAPAVPDAEPEGTLGLAPAVPEAVLDAEPVTVVAAGGVNSGGKPIPSPMESTSESKYAVPSANGSALRRGKTRGDRDLCDRFRETKFSVTVSYIPLNLS